MQNMPAVSPALLLASTVMKSLQLGRVQAKTREPWNITHQGQEEIWDYNMGFCLDRTQRHTHTAKDYPHFLRLQ
jgi:hypothetical protein